LINNSAATQSQISVVLADNDGSYADVLKAVHPNIHVTTDSKLNNASLRNFVVMSEGSRSEKQIVSLFGDAVVIKTGLDPNKSFIYKQFERSQAPQ
jgi:hypothetical protein